MQVHQGPHLQNVEVRQVVLLHHWNRNQWNNQNLDHKVLSIGSKLSWDILEAYWWANNIHQLVDLV